MFISPINMARKINAIEEINDSKETWKIAVRVISLCSVQTPSKFIEMILMDAKRYKIQAVARNAEVLTWKPKVKENETYVMQNFKVLCNEGEFKACDHPFKLQITSGTTCKHQELADIPKDYYSFKNFSEILSGNLRTDVLIDVIGAFHDIVRSDNSAPLKKASFWMKDLSGDMIMCTLWQDYASKFLEFHENHKSELIVVILTQAKIKEPEGKNPMFIQNSKFGSKLLINEDIVDIQKFKDSYCSVQANEGPSQSQSQLSNSKFTEQDKLTYKASVMSLSDINGLTEETTCVTIGTIAKFVVGKSGWSYEACSACTKKAEPHINSFTCKCGKCNEKTTLRYRLEVMVYNNKDSTRCVLWDQECVQIIGRTASELKNELLEEGEDDPLAYPEALDELLGRTMAFRLKMQPTYNAASVLKVSEDVGIIKFITEQLHMYEEKTNHANGEPVLEDHVQCESQSVSATANYDPNDSSPSVTPCKRSTEKQFDDLHPHDKATQFSATKIQKRIKKE
ncbi:unnamed protein product [Cuscuta epithymum]|uniref:Replication factor A C-terminal domain-containing protein n=1 Tax=Cuscuta epithymum TaxID=186058 RepID=A0AAV0CJM1_9ASTE|nr:unnamed protein product [Cuscuta epithymum]